MPCASGSKLTPGRAVVSRWYERTGAIRCTADAPAAKSRACGLPARAMTCRSCGGAAKPGPPPAISGPSSCRSTKPSTSSPPKASSGSGLDAHTRYKTCEAKLRAGLATAVAQALSEARQLLEAYPNSPDTAAIAGCFWPAMAPATADAAWLLDDAIRLQASNPLLAQIPMLEMGTAVDEQREIEVPLRV